MTHPVRIGYATNVHPGRTLDEALVEIDRVAPRVRERLIAAKVLASTDPLELGLWLSARAAARLRETPDGVARVADRLAQNGLLVRSLNGFPYGHFHDRRVKHEVYRPSWADADRLLHTQNLAVILADFVRAAGAAIPDARVPGESPHASVSTLPLGWREEIARGRNGAALGVAAAHLEQLVRFLSRLECERGVRIHVDLEPEPGCFLDTSEDLVRFFDEHLRPRAGDPDPRRYLGVCHDVCHAAVMWEEQSAMVDRFRDAGIRIGRVQLSSALEARGAQELHDLRGFVEPRYLHQTTLRDGSGAVRFFDDLPDALAALGESPGAGVTARTHLHVPLAHERAGTVGTTRREIESFLAALFRSASADEPAPAIEVETYTWPVLPDGLRPPSLDEGISAEIRWAASAVERARKRERVP